MFRILTSDLCTNTDTELRALFDAAQDRLAASERGSAERQHSLAELHRLEAEIDRRAARRILRAAGP